MKRLFSLLLALALALALLPSAAFGDSGAFDAFSDADLKYWYEEARKEMVRRGLSLAQELTLREGKYIVGKDIEPGVYTIKCTETTGDTYGDLYSSLGGLYGGSDSPLGGLLDSLGGMMSDFINTEVEIIGDYGTVLKSFELRAGESARITLEKGTALQISEGTCVLTEN